MHVTESVNCIPLSQLDVRELTRPSESPFLREGLASETRYEAGNRASERHKAC